MTSETQIEKARTFAETLLVVSAVVSSRVDDWDDYGGFNIIVQLNFGRDNKPLSGFSMKKVTNAIRKNMKGYRASIIQVPIRQYERSFGQSYFTGYDYDYLKIDLRIPE